MSRKGWIDWYHYDIPWETEKDFGEETIDLAAPDNDVAFRPMSTWTTLVSSISDPITRFESSFADRFSSLP
jgi:hypothetical protein